MSDEALKIGMPKRMADLDMEFHQIIYRASRSKTLYNICQNLRDHTLKYRIAVIHLPEVAKQTRDDHLKIFDALSQRDHSKVEEAIKNHLMDAMNAIMLLLEQSREESYI